MGYRLIVIINMCSLSLMTFKTDQELKLKVCSVLQKLLRLSVYDKNIGNLKPVDIWFSLLDSFDKFLNWKIAKIMNSESELIFKCDRSDSSEFYWCNI